jgi:hypothetical protein
VIYESIGGWFLAEDLYRQAVEQGRDGDVFVELGTFLGRSAAFMAETIKDSGKKIRFYTVDNHNFYRDMNEADRLENGIFNQLDHTIEDVKKNLEPLKDYVTIVQANSWEGIPGVDVVDWCFIDAGHDYERVKKDLDYWVPRSRIIGGDDWGFSGVRNAVKELGGKPETGQFWMFNPNPFFRD